MTSIADTGIAIVAQDGENISLLFGADIVFDDRDLRAGQSGLVEFKLVLSIYDSDLVVDDFVADRTRTIEPAAFAPRVGIDIPVDLSLRHLRLLENNNEHRIELYGDLRLMKDGHVLAVAKTRTIDVTLPHFSWLPPVNPLP